MSELSLGQGRKKLEKGTIFQQVKLAEKLNYITLGQKQRSGCI